MNQKQEVIQMIVQIDSVDILKKVKALLVNEVPSNSQKDFQIPQYHWQEVEQIRKDRKNGKWTWIWWEEVKSNLTKRKLKWAIV